MATINTSLLIAAPMLQDYLVDKDTGTPLANGIVTMYKDAQRTILKNWYYQTGVPGAYTYIALNNPLHLSSVGTIQDPNGNDVIPFYYPHSEDDQNIQEPYYVTVYSADETGAPAALQFTRENFPFLPPRGINPTQETPTLRNYITNNIYWRNAGALDVMNSTNIVVAPSQHDGYTFDMSDIRFVKDVTGANDDINFIACPSLGAPSEQGPTPEFCLEFQCSGTALGETVKCTQYPIALHVKNLSNVPFTIRFWAQNVSGAPHNFLDVYIYQYLGAGVSSSAPILLGRATLGTAMQPFIFSGIFPDATDAILGNGDDAYFLRIQFPLANNGECHNYHTKPQIYLGSILPTNDFDTYEQIAALINSARTGHIWPTFQTIIPYGWLLMNDTSIGNTGSAATNRANNDTWPLYYLLWTNVIDTYAPVSGGRGASAIADFNAGKTLTLTATLGRAIASKGTPSTGGTNWALGQPFGSETHTLSNTELPNPIGTPNGFDVAAGADSRCLVSGQTGPDTLVNTGGGQPHNIMNPSTHMNILIKL